MQRPDERKRLEIMRVAARMFAEHPFHEVRLEEVARRSRLSKGTIYVYFASKDELYTTLIAEGLEQLIAELRAGRTRRGSKAWPAVQRVAQSLLAFTDRFPHLYTLMRSGAPLHEGRLVEKRAELVHEIARVLRAGVRAGELSDPHPELTAEFLLGSVRTALLFAPKRLSRTTVARHLLRVLGRGILRKARR